MFTLRDKNAHMDFLGYTFKYKMVVTKIFSQKDLEEG